MGIIKRAQRLFHWDVPAEANLTGKAVAAKFYYSSRINQVIINQRIEDLAEFSGESKSNVIEDALKGLLPKEGTAADYVNHVLFGHSYIWGGGVEDYTIKTALQEIFASNAAGTNWRSVHDNLEPLVRFMDALLRQKGVGFMPEFGQRGWREFTLKHLDFVCNVLEEACKLADDSERPRIRVGVRYSRDLYRRLDESDAELNPTDFTGMLLENWDELKGSTWTYRYLNALVESCAKWRDTAADRVEFQEVCCEVMDVWDARRTGSVDAVTIAQVEIDAKVASGHEG